MRLFGSEKIAGFAAKLGISEDMPIDMKMVSGAIERAQKKIEAMHFQRRKNVLTYDDVMNQQRTVIYGQRNEILWLDDISEKIRGMIIATVSDTFDFCFNTDDGGKLKLEEFSQQFRGMLTDGKVLRYSEDELESLDKEAEKQKFIDKAISIYESKDELFKNVEGAPENAMREVEKVVLLRNVDLAWMDHLEAMDELKGYVGLNSYAQRDPVAIYKLESADMFDRMSEEIREKTVKEILSVLPRRQATERVQVAKETGTGGDGSQPKRRPVVTKGRVVGRNEYCPCGSGKKYKNCCWAKDQAKQ